MLKSRISCADIVKEIRREYNDIVWVSASIDGSRLKVQIKENEDTFREDTDDGSGEEHPTDLIAETDGVITQIVTRSGVPQVHAGDTVKAGDLLVSGRIEVLDDSGEVVGYQYQRSDADVFADTQIEYADSIPLTWQDKIYDGKKRYRWYVRFSTGPYPPERSAIHLNTVRLRRKRSRSRSEKTFICRSPLDSSE